MYYKHYRKKQLVIRCLHHKSTLKPLVSRRRNVTAFGLQPRPPSVKATFPKQLQSQRAVTYRRKSLRSTTLSAWHTARMWNSPVNQWALRSQRSNGKSRVFPTPPLIASDFYQKDPSWSAKWVATMPASTRAPSRTCTDKTQSPTIFKFKVNISSLSFSFYIWHCEILKL